MPRFAAPPSPRLVLRALFDAAVAAALPSAASIAPFLPPPPKGRTLVLGAGKAGAAMAAAVEAAWPAKAPLSGLVVTRYDYVPPAFAALQREGSARIEVVEAAHPVPDEAGRRAAERIAALAHRLTADDLVLCLISGGASSLLALPADGVSLDEKRAINRALLRSGAAIDEMNCVRKHLSAIKGGRLARACAPARVVSLLVSDVPGDSPATIGSGPTVADPTSCADALAVLDRYAIPISAEIRSRLVRGELETPKPGDAAFAGHAVHLIATPQRSLEAAAAVARALGIDAHILGDEIEGESREVAKVHAALARQVARRGQPFGRPCVVLSGGETTVTVRPGQPGRGGRASEFLLGCAIALNGEPRVHVLAADTDGIDGSEDNAGAFVGPDTLARAAALGLAPRAFLDRNDAYGFFEALSDLVVTGPTFTNVNDFRAMLVL
ncbi:MAG: glycerate kinase type-2 family protein [Caldimonas sp.]